MHIFIRCASTEFSYSIQMNCTYAFAYVGKNNAQTTFSNDKVCAFVVSPVAHYMLGAFNC